MPVMHSITWINISVNKKEKQILLVSEIKK